LYCARLAYFVLMVLLGIVGRSGSARGEDVAAARAAFERGTKAYNLAEYGRALESYKEAYNIKADPALLFNIAQCHRLLGHTDEAIAIYRSYLREAPDAKNRADVEKRIEELQAQQSIAATATPTADPATKMPPATTQETTAKPAGLNLSPPQAADATATNPSPESPTPSFYTRWWFWTAVGAVAAGATIGFLATRDPTHIPSSSLGSQKVLQ
jgi:tetratricopeptide (TPR) repeat protein